MTAAKKPRGARTPASRQVLGHKGGEKKQKKPTVASNDTGSIATAQLVYIWSWGPIVGPVDGLKSVKLDGTPLVAEDGTVNYPGVKWQFRSGELHQERLAGITEASNEIQVGQELRTQAPYLRSINNAMLDAVRVRLSWPQLTSQDSNGNISGVRIEYAIDVATDGGPYQTLVASEVNRKNITKYERDHRVELPAGSRWTVRVRRITPEAGSEFVQDGMYVEAIAELVDSDQEYPLTAVGGIEYDAQQFGGDIAKIAVLMRGRIVKVPANYNPETRTYATAGTGTSGGIWDGTFKEAYTNNPAWVLYDLVLNPYYGLGERINASMVNRWSLYRIAQFCDQLVPDGQGGQEPRFTCNLYLQKQADAWAVIQDLASIFHGLAFWDGSQIVVNADMPQDSAYTYTMAQIIGGNAVSYQGSKWRDRHSQAIVSFDDPAQGFETDKEPVFDEDAIAEFGVRELSVEAPGCTSRGQAQRAGNWALMTEQLQTRGTSIRVGLDGYIPKPGKVISLADPMLAGRANGGRIAAVAGRVVTVDRDIEVPTGARLLVNLPSGKAEARQVRSVAGRNITVMADYSEVPEAECGWALDYDDLKLMQFYVRNVTRPEWHQFQLELIQHEPSKFSAIDYGTMIDDRPISVLPPGVQAAPARVLITSHAAIDQGIAVTTMTIGWDAAPSAVAYEVEWRWGSRDWVRVPVTGGLTVDVRGVYAGQYLARVRAISAMDVSSIPTTSMLTEVAGKTTPPLAVTHLTTESLIFGIGLKWGFPVGAEDTQRTELWYSAGTVLAEATKLADLAYPQDKHTLQGLRAGQRFYFWARLVDKSGNVGPWFPSGTTLVTGQASADAGPVLDQIKGQVTESELGKQLTSKIEKIALIDGNGPGSVSERLGTAKTELAKQISDVNNALSTTKSNLQQQITAVSADVSAAKTDLQQQIANVSTLAGSLPYRKDKTYTTSQSALGADGKLYQALKAVPLNTPPPNADYWTDVGQAVVTANGVAARVSKVETDVSTLDGKATAQASQLSGLQTSLTTTNGNVTAAQNAADAANALAGGKGKVIIQAAAPATADRLAQNLWIDTTSNANTPKRWNGSAWVAVTDKAATDAAAAAQSALALAQTKADASVVSSLTTRVSDAEGKLTSQATRLDGMQTSIDGKASSQALQQVTSRVTATEQKDAAQDQQLTSQSQALTSLTDSVSKKAEVATVQALSNEVKQQGQSLTAQGTSLTKIEATLPGLAGENLLYNPSFERKAPGDTGLADGWLQTGASGTTRKPSLVPSMLAPAEFAQRLDATGLGAGVWIRLQSTDEKRASVSAGQSMTFSVYMRATPGLILRAELYFRRPDGTPSASGGGVAGLSITATGSFQRVTVSGVTPDDASICAVYPVAFGTAAVTSGFLEADRAQLEAGEIATGWRDSGQVNAADAVANATATTLLAGRVSKNEEGIKSASELTTQLSNSLVTTNGNVDKAQSAAQAANDLAGGKGKVIVQSAAPATADRLAQNLWIDTTGNANMPKRWNGSAWVAVTDKVATDAAAAAASALDQLTKKADASALNTLKSAVEQNGRDISAQGLSLTALNAGIANLGASGVNLVPAEYSQFARNPPPLAGTSFNASITADSKAFKGFALKLDWTNASSALAVHFAKDLTDAAANMAFRRQKYIISFYAKASVAGHQVSAYLRTYASASGTTTLTGPTTGNLSLTTEWGRYSALVDYTGANFSVQEMMILSFQMNRSGESGRAVWLDRIMVETAVNDVSVPSLFVAGTSFDQALANADATNALTARVVKTEGDLTTTAGQITSLNTSIGEVGGENLLYNSSFEKRTLGNTSLADGWTQTGAGGTTRTPSLVPSQLVPAGFAQRLDVTGFGRNVWVRLQPVDAKRVSVSAGQMLTFSVYMRGTAGLIIRAEVYFRKADGSPVSGIYGASLTAGSSFQRVEVTTAVPADAASCEVYPVAFGTDAISTGFVEVDRAQLEQSSRATGWRDNGQVVQSDQTATSTAVDSLNSVVSQQAGKIDSTASRTTALENTVNSTTSGLATKASTAAMNTLSGRVTATETGLTAASNSVNRLSSQIGVVGGTGSNLIPAEYSTFTDSPPSLHRAATLTLSSEQDANAYSGYLLKADSTSGVAWLYLSGSAGDYTLRLTPGRQYIFSTWAKGSAAHSVGVRLRYQNSAGAAVEVGLSSMDVGTSLGRVSTVITIPSAAVGPASVVLYTQAGSAAGATWFDGFMLEEKVGESTAPSAFTPGTSTRQAAGQATALTALDTKVTQQGTRIDSEAKRTDGLYTSVGNANAAIQDEATTRTNADSALSTRITTAQAKANDAAAAVQSEITARANADSALGRRVDDTQASLGNTNAFVQQVSTAQVGLDNKVNASYSVRLQVVNGNQYVAAGFGAGIENNGGVLQSTFAVMADRFAVLNPSGNGFMNPFAIQNGQVFINDAFISKLAVQNAMVGSSIQSSSMTSYGVPIMSADFVNGQITARDPSSSSTYSFMNRDGLVVVIDGAIRVRMGKW